MNIELIINLSYIISAILFIYGLKMLSSPATARNGNMLSSIGMLIAVTVTLFHNDIIDYKWIILGIAIVFLGGSVLVALFAVGGWVSCVIFISFFGVHGC